MPILKNARWEIFAQARAKGKSYEEAYVLAGFKKNRGNALRLNTYEIVQARVQEILARGAERAEISEEMVLRELGRIAFSDIRKAVKWSRRKISEDAEEINEVVLKDSSEIDDETAASIAEISQLASGGLRIKFHDKKAALSDLGRHFGMFKDKIELGGHVQVANTELLKKLSPEERAIVRGILQAAAARAPEPANQNGVVPARRDEADGLN